MKKILLIASLFLSVSFLSFSQVGIKGGFAFGLPKPAGGNIGFYPGFELGVTYNVSEQLRTEFLIEGMFRNNSNGMTKISSRIMPITVGADYSFIDGGFRPYAGLNLGLYNQAVNLGNLGGTNSVFFGIHPKAGFSYEISNNLLFDLTAKYHLIFSQGVGRLFGANVGIIYLF